MPHMTPITSLKLQNRQYVLNTPNNLFFLSFRGSVLQLSINFKFFFPFHS